MEGDKYVVNIREAVLAADQSTLFENADINPLIKSCIEYIRFNGYKVTKLPKYIDTVKSLDDLIGLFYSILEFKYPEYINEYRNVDENRSIAKLFVKARKEASGFSEKQALNECAEIIRTVFNYAHEFNFKNKPTFRMFGQDKSGWVTDKAIQIMNRNLEIENEYIVEKRQEEMIEAQCKDNLGFGDLKEILEKSEKINNGG